VHWAVGLNGESFHENWPIFYPFGSKRAQKMGKKRGLWLLMRHYVKITS
jgi:hypothetical protein